MLRLKRSICFPRSNKTQVKYVKIPSNSSQNVSTCSNMLQHAPFSLTGMEVYIKEKLQNEATNMLTSVDFMTYRLPLFARPSPLDLISLKQLKPNSSVKRQSLSPPNMPTSYLSTLLSSIALCITMAKFSISV